MFSSPQLNKSNNGPTKHFREDQATSVAVFPEACHFRAWP
jgi:hypothetical protein